MFARSATPLRRVYLMRPEEAQQPDITTLSSRDAAMAALQHTFVLDPQDPLRLARQLELACEVLERVDVRDLRYARQIDRLEDVQLAVRRDLAT